MDYRYFSEPSGPRPFTRQYRFIAPVFLQEAPITLRDNGFFVGEARLQETSKGGVAFLNMGDATDVTHWQTVKVVSEVKVKNKVQSRTYQNTMHFKSLRDRTVDLRFTYNISPNRPVVLLCMDKGWQRTGRELVFGGILKARKSKTLSFKVRFDHQ